MTQARATGPDVLTEIETAIEAALDNRQKPLLGALYRIQGSIMGWCGDRVCGRCPLAPMRCVSDLDERLDELLAEHHGEAALTGRPSPKTPSAGDSDESCHH